MTVYQIIHDLAFHACPALGGNTEFEKSVVTSLGATGHALCVSNNTRSDLQRYFDFPLERSSVFYPGIRDDIRLRAAGASADIPRMRSLLKLPPASPYIVALSTLEPRKNLPTTLKAFQTACSLLPGRDLHLVLAGSRGDQRLPLDALPSDVRARIRVPGYLQDALVPPLLAGAVCLLYPSLYEGFGMPPLEAMVCGTPVIVSNAGSLPEVVGDAAEVVDVFDHATMAQTISSWVLHPEARAECSAKGRERAQAFTWEAVAAALVEIFQARTKVAP